MTSVSASGVLPAPSPISDAAQAAFEREVGSAGLDPSQRWIGGYVDYEWTHLRPVLAAYGIDVAGQSVLELGCNVGASAVVLAALGADVQGVDVDLRLLGVAQANARRYGYDIAFTHVADSRRLPFAAAAFDLVTCNSVLEYVQPALLAGVQRELDRVLRPGGLILVSGTSSRLWPREVHSGRWLVNYLPRSLVRRLRLSGHPVCSVWPWTIRRGFGRGYSNLDALDGGRAFIAARAAMQPPQAGWPKRALARLAGSFGVGPGLLMNSISCVLRKDETP
ncbi:class I SAM-dependent methyltransferase [Thiohalocapsa sp. ML1]|jgi:SAM-dependent methyltransferase|uniref:class I SAM-dependent methyltransferase n=1 Tax=Thiohalocapsa sp. ML1 TaxID=1431688 RepID=UPI00073233C4|nr:class I SAM-dependent methyltransferase [Thiohalocapsa sp. ML1]